MVAKHTLAVEPLAVDDLLRIVNEWSDATYAQDREGYPKLGEFRHRMSVAWKAVGSPDTSALIRVANWLRPVFSASGAAAKAQALDHLLQRAGLLLTVTSSDDDLVPTWRVRDPLAGAAALTLLEVLDRNPDSTRLGTCEVDECLDAYIDQSPSGRRRFCTLTCQNRARARAFRARARTTP
jgi:predicted RNA-binding Zn ribbon-like protein